ncbi:MAG TPA: hypothetical protein VJ874_02020 [Candidatus Thermoplasmatota archaeon]|nr:hypothetical protein [Candidatus Thermoplasmatota archaeon]
MRASIGLLLAVAALTALLLPAPAAGHPESAAPSLRPDVFRAGHEPEVVMPHTQWTGFLELEPGTNVTAAYYQVCRVGQACFAPPTPATRVLSAGEGGPGFRFDTATYLANGKPVDYEAGWRIGVTWLLEERLANGTTQMARFPAGPDVLSPECQGDAAMACAEAHYLAFDIPAEGRDSPPAPLLSLLAALGLAAFAARLRK